MVLCQFIEDNTTEDDFTEKLALEVQKIKENKEWQAEYMTLLMREREKYKEGEADGKIAGKAEGIIETALELGVENDDIRSLLCKKLNIDTEQAGEYLKSYYEGTL